MVMLELETLHVVKHTQMLDNSSACLCDAIKLFTNEQTYRIVSLGDGDTYRKM